MVHHADVVGSMLNPPELIAARGAMRAGELPYPEYRAIEDRAVDEAIKIQEEAGLEVVTDGELRRDIFFSFFIAGMTGMTLGVPSRNIQFRGPDGEITMEVPVPASITHKIEAGPCPGVDEFLYASSKTDKQVKIALPSPGLLLGAFWNENSVEAYPDPFDLAREAGDVVAQWMRDLAEAGCTYMQIDAPELATAYTDPLFQEELVERKIDPDGFVEVITEIIGKLSHVDVPGVTKAMHVCKGNGTQSWKGDGSYDEFAKKVFAEADGFDVYHLEYDDERSGDFAPLAELPDEKVAVLGLVSTKWTAMEKPEELKARIDEAAQFHPKEHLAIATQCGFASAAETAEDRKITEQTQVDKLKLVVDVANDVWG